MQLSIIIISYNVKHFLEQCLCSVHKAILRMEAEVWVVDNASQDGSVEFLKPKFPWVNFLENAKNVGFAKANNLALKQCRGKYVLFLNPDTLIAEDTLVRCFIFMEANARAGALGVRMIDGSGAFLPESKRSLPSPLSSFYKLAGLSRLFPNSQTFSRYSLTYLSEFRNHEVEVLSGAFMLVKKDLLVQLKGFDEAFFMYGEDIDLSFRIAQMGYKNYYFSDCTIIHFKGESTQKASIRYTTMFYKAMSIFVRKHYAERSSGLQLFFLHFGVWSAASLSAAAQLPLKAKKFLSVTINNLFRPKNAKLNIRKKHYWVVAGNDEEYEEVKTLLCKSGVGEKLISRAAINEDEWTGENKKTEIVFCAGILSYLYIIEIIQHLPKKMSLRFHASRSESIVGSDSKNTSGNVIS